MLLHYLALLMAYHVSTFIIFIDDLMLLIVMVWMLLLVNDRVGMILIKILLTDYLVIR